MYNTILSAVKSIMASIMIKIFPKMKTISRYNLIRWEYKEGEMSSFEFKSGVKVSGIRRSKIRHEGKWVVFTFTDCTVSYEGKILYEPSWGPYDMAVGSSIISCFSGPADPAAFGLSYPVPSEKTHKIAHTEKAKQLSSLYNAVRDIRENKASLSLLSPIWVELKNNFPEDWLCALEIMELSTHKKEGLLYRETMNFLEDKKSESEAVKKLLEDGFALLEAE